MSANFSLFQTPNNAPWAQIAEAYESDRLRIGTVVAERQSKVRDATLINAGDTADFQPILDAYYRELLIHRIDLISQVINADSDEHSRNFLAGIEKIKNRLNMKPDEDAVAAATYKSPPTPGSSFALKVTIDEDYDTHMQAKATAAIEQGTPLTPYEAMPEINTLATRHGFTALTNQIITDGQFNLDSSLFHNIEYALVLNNYIHSINHKIQKLERKTLFHEDNHRQKIMILTTLKNTLTDIKEDALGVESKDFCQNNFDTRVRGAVTTALSNETARTHTNWLYALLNAMGWNIKTETQVTIEQTANITQPQAK